MQNQIPPAYQGAGVDWNNLAASGAWRNWVPRVDSITGETFYDVPGVPGSVYSPTTNQVGAAYKLMPSEKVKAEKQANDYGKPGTGEQLMNQVAPVAGTVAGGVGAFYLQDKIRNGWSAANTANAGQAGVQANTANAGIVGSTAAPVTPPVAQIPSASTPATGGGLVTSGAPSTGGGVSVGNPETFVGPMPDVSGASTSALNASTGGTPMFSAYGPSYVGYGAGAIQAGMGIKNYLGSNEYEKDANKHLIRDMGLAAADVYTGGLASAANYGLGKIFGEEKVGKVQDKLIELSPVYQVMKAFGTGKDKDQFGRDQIRKGLKKNGLVDDKYGITLADGSTFNIGLDGKAKLQNMDGQTERNTYDVDFSNPLAGKAVSLLQPMADQFLGEKATQKAKTDFIGLMSNAALSNAQDEATLQANINSMFQPKPQAQPQKGVMPAQTATPGNNRNFVTKPLVRK